MAIGSRSKGGLPTMADPKGNRMFWTIAAILVFLWLLGLVIGYTMAGVHSAPAGGRPYRGAH